MEKLNVAIADDNERVVSLLEHIVSQDKDLQVVGKEGDGEALCQIIREKEPDVVLLDIIMPKVDGLTVMDRVNRDPSIRHHPAFIVISAVGQEKITENINDFLPENSRGTQTNIRDITCIRRRTHCSAEPD